MTFNRIRMQKVHFINCVKIMLHKKVIMVWNKTSQIALFAFAAFAAAAVAMADIKILKNKSES